MVDPAHRLGCGIRRDSAWVMGEWWEVLWRGRNRGVVEADEWCVKMLPDGWWEVDKEEDEERDGKDLRDVD